MRAVLFVLLMGLGVSSLQPAPNPEGSVFPGTWVLNLEKSKLPSGYPYRSMTLQVAVVFDTVTIGGRFVTTAGQTQTATELFHVDGKEHPGTLHPGVVITARWIDARTLETGGKKDGQDVGVITCQVSRDGRSLTQKYSSSPEQELVFERR
jgi:hypothetical protein